MSEHPLQLAIEHLECARIVVERTIRYSDGARHTRGVQASEKITNTIHEIERMIRVDETGSGQ